MNPHKDSRPLCSLDAHLAGNVNSGYVSGTPDINDAAPFAEENGWAYEFDRPGDAINVEEYYFNRDGYGYGPYGSESEFAVPHTVDPATISRAHEIGPNELPTGNIIPNPGYHENLD